MEPRNENIMNLWKHSRDHLEERVSVKYFKKLVRMEEMDVINSMVDLELGRKYFKNSASIHFELCPIHDDYGVEGVYDPKNNWFTSDVFKFDGFFL